MKPQVNGRFSATMSGPGALSTPRPRPIPRKGINMAKRTRRHPQHELLATLLLLETDDCVLWPGTPSGNGYGQIQVANRRYGPHVLACEYRHGPRPSSTHEAAHHCNTPLCVNPRHLRWATRKENAADRIANGTAQRGEQGTLARLTVAQVRDIRGRASESKAALGREFNVTEGCIRCIINRQSWAWLDDPALYGTPTPQPGQGVLPL